MKNNGKFKLPRFYVADLLCRLIKSRFFLQNFLFITGIMTCIFILFSLYTYRQSANILKNEFTASSRHQLEATAQSMDDHLMDMRYIIATLDTNTLVNAFFSYKHPENIYDEFYARIQDMLKSYVNSHSSIDSIYLYSEISDSVLTANNNMRVDYLSDLGWMERFTEEPDGLQLFFRAKNAYPFVLCIMKQYKINNKNAAIILNLNLNNYSQIVSISDNPYQEIYIVSDDAEILYRNRQRELTEPLDTVPELASFQASKETHSLLVENVFEPYVYSQVHSSEYPWSYVSITHLQEYTSQLSSSRALLTALFCALFIIGILFAFLFALRSVKPIQNILLLLKNPQESLARELYNDKEIQYIADQITSYIQQNQTLSDELTIRLNLLNETKLLALQSQINPHFLFNTLNMIHIRESQELGFEHEIPIMTLKLSQLLHYAIESTNLVPLNIELNYTQMYISILQQRYNNKLKVIYDIHPDTLEAKVPKLFIQPIIENAIYHGLSENMNENSRLSFSSHILDEQCVIVISDNGVGMDDQALQNLYNSLEESNTQKSGIGLKNVVTRMRLLFGEKFDFAIESKTGEGSTFTLKFPFIQ